MNPISVMMLVCCACLIPSVCAVASDFDTLVRGLSPEQAARFERFRDFRINGVCGVRELELARQFGVNTVRGYTINLDDNGTRRALDEAHALGIKVIVSEWMPHHGQNKGRDDTTYTFDYAESGDRMVASFREKVESLGDHPAILMWGMGNEVHLDREYLEVVNRMSLVLHELQPNALSSLTMINAKPENIEKIKRWAPDLDVIGVQSYSSGAVRGGIRNMEEHWDRPYYYSEFNSQGPWNFGKTAWGTAYDSLPAAKLADLRRSYEAIHAAPRCLGSTIFVWGYFRPVNPSYFSLLLPMDPAGASPGEPHLITPQAEAMAYEFLGRWPRENRAPLLSKLELTAGGRDATLAPRQKLSFSVDAEDPDGDAVRFVAWMLHVNKGRITIGSGPINQDSPGVMQIEAPDEADSYLLMVYAMDDHGGGSVSTLPINVTPNAPAAGEHRSP